MTITPRLLTLSLVLLPALVSPLAAASGKHADGHMGGQQATQAASIGEPGKVAQVSRTIELVMRDTMRFEPDHITVKPGETVRFAVRNAGKIPHEFVIGSMDELKEHAAMMRQMPTMQHHDSDAMSLQPGERGELVWHFARAGKVDFACLVPGHMEAGMAGTVTVAR